MSERGGPHVPTGDSKQRLRFAAATWVGIAVAYAVSAWIGYRAGGGVGIIAGLAIASIALGVLTLGMGVIGGVQSAASISTRNRDKTSTDES